MKIITAPHQTLRQQAKEVSVFDKKFLRFLSELADTLVKKEKPSGVGLAAPQVNKSLRVFAAILGEKNKAIFKQSIKFFINPKIVKHSKDKILGLADGSERFEGCLSIPLLYGPVPRFSWVEVEYQSLTDKDLLKNKNSAIPVKKKIRLEDFDARVFQHEFDHLNGVLFTDHILANKLPIYVEQDGEWVQVKNSDEILGLL